MRYILVDVTRNPHYPAQRGEQTQQTVEVWPEGPGNRRDGPWFGTIVARGTRTFLEYVRDQLPSKPDPYLETVVFANPADHKEKWSRVDRILRVSRFRGTGFLKD